MDPPLHILRHYQDTLTDSVGTSIRHDFEHFNWKWLNERKKS